MIEINEVTGTEQMKQVYQIRKEVFIQEQKVPESIELDGFDDLSLHFILYEDHKPVSTLRLRPVGGDLKVERVATIKEARGKGYATKLMEHIQTNKERFEPTGRLKMHAQLDAKGFYEKLGWQVQSEIFYEAGIAHILMIYQK